MNNPHDRRSMPKAAPNHSAIRMKQIWNKELLTLGAGNCCWAKQWIIAAVTVASVGRIVVGTQSNYFQM